MRPNTDTRQRLLVAARQLIVARSYADVGVAEICGQAGVAKGSFYHFFSGKRDLTVAMLDAGLVDLKQELLDKAFATDLSPMARLRRFASLNIRYQAAMHRDTGRVPGCQFGNLAAEQATQDDVLRRKLAAAFDGLSAELQACLRDAVAAGQVSGIDVAATATAMLAYLEGSILMAKVGNDPGLLEQLLPAMPEIRIVENAADG